MLRKSIAVLGAMSVAMGALIGLPVQAVRAESPRPTREEKRGAVSLSTWTYPRRGPTMAQQQRAARKARNVRRHKAHVRGAK